MKKYRFGYLDEFRCTRVYECYAYNLDHAFDIFGPAMERLYGLNAHHKIVLIEVLENGISVKW